MKCRTNSPRDSRTTDPASELSITLADVKFHDAESLFTIIRDRDGNACVGLVSRDYLTIGLDYRLMGRWVLNQKFGRQFAFDTISKAQPLTQHAVIQYLVEHCPGVGRAKAAKLWSLFAGDTMRTLRESPESIPADILSPEQVEIIRRSLEKHGRAEETKAELFGMLARRGFGRKIYDQLLNAFGARAPEMIRRNPFMLQTKRFAGAGFKRCDKLWLELGKPKDALKRQLLALCASLVNDRDGNTWVPAESLVERINDMMSDGRPRPKKCLQLGLRSNRLAKKWMPTLSDTGMPIFNADGTVQRSLWLALKSRADDEERIAGSLASLLRADTKWPDESAIPLSQVPGDGLPSEHQRNELMKALQSPVGCFTGSPGSGKTHVFSYLIIAILQTFRGASIKVCAPTGKAAIRCTESLRARRIPIKAKTIHSTLGIGRNGHDGDGWGFTHNAKNPLDCQFLFVDEASMLDAPLMASLLEACKPGTHVLFVGDTNQLPPVGHGSPFLDLIESAANGGA